MKSPTGKVVRVDEHKASVLYEEGFRYISKEQWKNEVRDINKNPNDDVEPEPEKKHNKPSKAQKRHVRKKL